MSGDGKNKKENNEGVDRDGWIGYGAAPAHSAYACKVPVPPPPSAKTCHVSSSLGKSLLTTTPPEAVNPPPVRIVPAGNTAKESFTVTVNPPTPSPPPIPPQIIDKIISTIQNLDDNVPQSVKTSLIAVLKEVSNILGDINPNNDESACGKLGAFINQVNAAGADRRNNNGTMTAHQADDLRMQAEDITIKLLDC